jgi:hypothetical protein
MQDLLPIGAFAALLFIIFAVLQVVRDRIRVGTWGTILAFVAVSISILVLTLASGDTDSTSLVSMLVLANAVIVLVVSLVILVLDWRRSTRDLDHSFGVLGVGVSVLLIAGVFITPSLLSLVSDGALPGEAIAQADALPDVDANTREFVRDTAADTGTFSRETVAKTDDTTVPENTAANPVANMTDSVLAQVLAAETGLPIEELNAQLEAGTPLADRVTANGGNLDTVKTTMIQAIETALAAGTIPEQLASRMGEDVADYVGQVVNGELPSRAVTALFDPLLQPDENTLLTGELSNRDGANVLDETNVNIVQDNSDTPNLVVEAVPMTVVPTAAPLITDEPAVLVIEAVVTDEVTPAPVMTNTPTLEPTVAPTTPPIVFEDTGVCQVAVNYLINLRAEPNVESQILTTVPYTAVVNAVGHNANGWWLVTYDGLSGWVSGDYITPNTVCQNLSMLP